MPHEIVAQTLQRLHQPDDLTPAEARLIALDLVTYADNLEGGTNPMGFVTRWEVLAELDELRRTVEALTA